jgi:hypothetical protein
MASLFLIIVAFGVLLAWILASLRQRGTHHRF